MKVSIITATFNSEKSIQQTINSVVNQDYADIEHIIIDGGSTDATLEIIKKNNGRISLLVSEKDKGIYDALNKGIKIATGDIVGFLNSDDVFDNPQIISRVINCFKIKKSDVVYGNLIYQSKNESKKRTIRYWRSNAFNPGCLWYGWMPPHPTLYCKKEIYNKFGLFDDNFKISADYDFILRVFKEPTINKTYLPTIMVKMNVGGASNKSIKNIIQKSTEDYKAIRNNKIGGLPTLILKNIRKIGQFNALKNIKVRC